MITYTFLQQYWWFLISLLGGLLVFLLFVQGGNSLIFLAGKEGGFEERKVVSASAAGALVLMSVEGIEDRDVAVAMKNTVIYLHRDDIPVSKGQMLLADMIGLAVIDANTGENYGTIKEVNDVPRGLLYTVDTPKGDVYYPSGKEFIKEIDEEKGMLITPIPGFFD